MIDFFLDCLAFAFCVLAAAAFAVVVLTLYALVFWVVWTYPLWPVLSVVWLFGASCVSGRLLDRRERRLRLVREIMES